MQMKPLASSNEKMARKNQYLEQQIQQVQGFVEELENSLDQVASIKESLEELKNTKGNEEMLAPIANGIFIKAKMLDNQKLKVNVGNGAVVEKTIPETIALLEKQEEEIKKSMNEAIQALEEYYSKLYQENLSKE